jgi:hypothetical protein
MRYSPVIAPAIAVLLLCVPRIGSAAGAFDGHYAGRITNVKHATVCGKADSWGGSFVVAADKFSTNVGGGKLPMSGDVRPDGSFETTSMLSRTNNLHLVGKIVGATLHATATTGLCEWTFDMAKQAG